jgi:hypothetical protein
VPCGRVERRWHPGGVLSSVSLLPRLHFRRYAAPSSLSLSPRSPRPPGYTLRLKPSRCRVVASSDSGTREEF